MGRYPRLLVFSPWFLNMSEPKSSRAYVTLAVSFHIVVALAVTICNKAVLNIMPAPVTLLFSQAVMSIIFIHIASMLKICTIPRIDSELIRALAPLLAMRVIAQLSKIYCLLVCLSSDGAAWIWWTSANYCRTLMLHFTKLRGAYCCLSPLSSLSYISLVHDRAFWHF